MTPVALHLSLGALRGLAFASMATLGAGDFLPGATRLGLGVLLVLIAWSGPVSGEAARVVGENGLLPVLGGQALVAAVAGWAFSLPFRVLLSSSGEVGERLARGGGNLPRTAILIGALSWTATGGLESLLRVFLQVGQGSGPGGWAWLASADLVAHLGSVVFAAVAGAMLPALAFLLGLRTFLALVTLPASRRPPWISTLVTLGGLAFLLGTLTPLAQAGQQTLTLGGRWILGGG